VSSQILVVDDDTDLVETLVRLLGRFGHRCLRASTAEEAMLLIDSKSPRLVVTDLHMPGTDGLAVVRRAREKTPPIPVILMTAYPTAERHAAAENLRTFQLRKPFANSDLLKLVEDALAGA
jgi:DNA-binding NtrC family response regulator